LSFCRVRAPPTSPRAADATDAARAGYPPFAGATIEEVWYNVTHWQARTPVVVVVVGGGG
jgi:hypothetical protein